MGNIHLQQGDTAKALEMYEKAIAESTQAGKEKATVLVQAGDIYYQQHNYVKAQPCYREAVTILTAEHPDFARVQLRSEMLDELILAYQQVQLQDSLQRLSRMSDEEQRQVVEQIITELIAQEKIDSVRQAQAAREAARGDEGPRSVNTANMLGNLNTQRGEWYFYNLQLVKQGAQEWRRVWGNRILEDNWRRQNKQVTASYIDDGYAEATDSLVIEGDSTVASRQAPETDKHKPEYYLQQIPRTPEALAMSDSLWREAMVALFYIYRDKVQDEPMAEETMRLLEERFAGHPQLVDVYYSCYLYALRYDQQEEAADWRAKIMKYYPESTQAQIVGQPDYFDRLRRMAQEQDSLYAQTYNAYVRGQYNDVKSNKQYAEREYPLSPLMPRFLFLNAVAVARTEGQDAFVAELQDVVARYPETQMGAMAKDMLAMMGQGMESQKGGSTGSLADMRGQVDDNATDSVAQEQTWSEDRNQPSVVLLCLSKTDEQALNDLLYEVAVFNFSQFLIRDFDLQKMPVLGTGSALRVSGFKDMDEAEWWIDLLQQSEDMKPVIQNIQIKAVTEVNLPLL
jgi:tetratricopeptide (TPR) repeat protein